MNEPLQEGGFSPAVRLTTREKSKPRTDKAQCVPSLSPLCRPCTAAAAPLSALGCPLVYGPRASLVRAGDIQGHFADLLKTPRLIQAGRLHGRRENREIDELTAHCATLTRQLEDARAEVESLKASGAAGAGGKKAEKAVQKEMDALAKKVRRGWPCWPCFASAWEVVTPCPLGGMTGQDITDSGAMASQVRRLEEDRDAAVAAKDALAAKVSALESSLATDARLVKLNADLDTERTRGASLAGKLRTAQEESAAFSRRLAQIEKGAETTAEMQMNRQKKEYNEKVSKLESMVASLEQVRPHGAFALAQPDLAPPPTGQVPPRRPRQILQDQAGVASRHERRERGPLTRQRAQTGPARGPQRLPRARDAALLEASTGRRGVGQALR